MVELSDVYQNFPPNDRLSGSAVKNIEPIGDRVARVENVEPVDLDVLDALAFGGRVLDELEVVEGLLCQGPLERRKVMGSNSSHRKQDDDQGEEGVSSQAPVTEGASGVPSPHPEESNPAARRIESPSSERSRRPRWNLGEAFALLERDEAPVDTARAPLGAFGGRLWGRSDRARSA